MQVIQYMAAIVLRIVSDCMGGMTIAPAHATIAPCCLSILSFWTIYGADIALIAAAHVNQFADLL